MALNEIDFGGSTLVTKDIKVGATAPGQAGTSISSTELGFIDAVTPGTAAASKALVLNSSSGITSGLTLLTATTVTAPTGNITAVVSPTNLTLNATGTGTIGIGSVSTGAVTITPATTVTGTLAATNAATVGTTLGVTGLTTATGGVTIGAGTNTVAPLVIASGTNLTTAAVGAEEFDGKVFYKTALASSRQVIDTVQFATTGATPVALSNSSTGAQNVFDSANDVLSLAASTTYMFEAYYSIATGTTTHTTATAFTASSAFTSINYWAELWSTTSGTISTTAPSVLDVAASTATVLNATSTAPLTTIRVRGIIRTNAASTVTPTITFSSGPTGTCQVNTNSYFRIWPKGTSTVAAVGNWS